LVPELRFILVFHDPGLSEGLKLVEDLVSRLSQQVRFKIIAYPISDVERGVAGIEEGDVVFALLPFRGGHLVQVTDYALGRRALGVYKIPLDLIARRVVERLEGCRSATLLYWRAKRFVEEQEEDLKFIASTIKRSLGVEVRLASSCEDRVCDGCLVVTSLLPGRLTLEALRSGGEVRIPYLLEILGDDVVAWIKGYAERLYDLQASQVG
jgi:hypothetical protein